MDYEENYDDFLQHYGVLGMKWGKRKARSNVSSNKKPKNTKNTTTSKLKPKPKPEPPQRRLSDAELRAAVNRLRLEREYSELTYKASSRAKVESVARTIGTVATLTTSAITIYNNLNKISKIAGMA